MASLYWKQDILQHILNELVWGLKGPTRGAPASTVRAPQEFAFMQPEPDDSSAVLFTDAAATHLLGKEGTGLGCSLVPEAAFGASIFMGPVSSAQPSQLPPRAHRLGIICRNTTCRRHGAPRPPMGIVGPQAWVTSAPAP